MKLNSFFAALAKPIASAIVPATLFSCSAPKYVYSPPTANLLKIENKKDINMAINYASADNAAVFGNDKRSSSGADLQAVFAAGKRVVIRVDGYTKSERNRAEFKSNLNIPEEKNIYKKNGMSVAAGIYNFSKTKDVSVFQLAGGIGFGRTSFISYNSSYAGSQNYYSADYVRFFVQPSAVIRISEYYTGTIANTFSQMNYKRIRTDLSNIKDEPLGYIGTKPSFFSELALQNEFGFPKLKGIRFQAQLGFSKLLTKFSSGGQASFPPDYYDYHNTWFAAGVVADISRLLIKKQAK